MKQFIPADGQEKSHQGQQFAVTHLGQQVSNQRPQKYQAQQCQRPDRRRVSGGANQESHRDDVLQHQNADRQVAVPGFQLPAFIQNFDHAHRAAEAEGKGDQRDGFHVHIGELLQTEHRQPHQQCPDQDHPEKHVGDGAAPHFEVQQLLELDL